MRHTKLSGFSRYKTAYLILGKRPDLVIVNKKENLPNNRFCRPSGPQTENQRKRKQRQIIRSCLRTKKKLLNIRVTMILIVIGALGTLPKDLVRGLEELELGGRAETIQTTILFRSARILRRVQET